MTEIRFYHLSSISLEQSLPKFLERAWIQGHRIVVRATSPERVEHLNAILWTYEEASFLPHGSMRDGNAATQPIWLTHRGENPNGATLLIVVDGVEAADIASYARCTDLFDGNDAGSLEAARARWRRARDAGHALTYWRQTTSGWEQKS